MRSHASALVLALCAACAAVPAPEAAHAPRDAAMQVTFDDDVAFLRAHGGERDVIVLEDARGARIAVSPRYQGRVMTSAFARNAPSLGWVNRPFIEAGKTATAFDNYGGEDRFWLGPEGGQFALYFAPGKPFIFSEWQTPHALQEGAWTVTASSKASVSLTHAMTVTNWSGATFELAVTRVVRLVDAEATSALLKGTSGARSVAFETVNTITNTGARAWNKETGLLSIWILGMFAPASDARIVIPYRRDVAAGAPSSPVVNDRYFGKISADRLQVREADACVVFTADGRARGKIGVAPARATTTLASYSASTKLLTLVTIAAPDATRAYVDNTWEKQANPFGGDAVNAYNDGPTEPGKASLGGFYELESSSPAAALAPGESITHTHHTMHVVVDDRVRAAIDAGALAIPARCLY